MNLETLNERVQALLGVFKSTFTFSQSALVSTSEFSTHGGNTEAMPLHSKRRKIMESACDVSLVNIASYDQPINEIIPSKGLQAGQISVGINNMPTLEKDVIIIDDESYDQSIHKTIPSKGLEKDVIIIDDDDEEEKDLERHGITDNNNNSMEMDIGANSNIHVPIPIDVAYKISEPKSDQEKHTKSSNRINDVVSLIDSFTRNQIK